MFKEKTLVTRYQRLRPQHNVVTAIRRTTSLPTAVFQTNTIQNNLPAATQQIDTSVRCFNGSCSEHYQSACPNRSAALPSQINTNRCVAYVNKNDNKIVEELNELQMPKCFVRRSRVLKFETK